MATLAVTLATWWEMVIAARPVSAAVIARLAVYEAHLRYGARRSDSNEATATIMAANAPNRTAANSVGTREIDSETPALSWTRLRSAIAATTASRAITYGFPSGQPESARTNTITAAATHRTTT